MPKYKILLKDRNYSNWSFVNDETNEDVSTDDLRNIQPVNEKLFSKDVFMYDIKTNVLFITYSHIRSGISIAGILMLENNKTYGRTQNKKRLLYKCIPDDKQLPAFLVPYDISVGFSKIQSNKYVIFKYDSWINQHPQGVLLEVLGDVGNLDVFYEYQLYCKSLHVSLASFTNKAREQLRKKTNEEYIEQILRNPDFQIEDRRHISNIITIDPENSMDFDDAFSIEQINKSEYKLTIYIANVYFWLETLGLWKSFSSRVSTIYLPDRRRPMLPTILSDNLCSLQEGEPRFAFAMDLFMDQTGKVDCVEFKNVIINVAKNYRYEQPELIYKNADYKIIEDITKRLDKSATDSHDVVAYWMVRMNVECGNYMANKGIGIFRMANYIEPIENAFQKEIDILDVSVQRVIKMWSNISGKYSLYDENSKMEHEIMRTANYSQITSPIRRLVDLLNQMWISMSLNIIERPSNDASDFFNKWLKQMEYLNTSMRSIRKIQTDCEVLHRCFNDPTIMDSMHKGVLFDKIKKNDGSIMYMVYLAELKLLSRIKIYEDFSNYTTHRFKLFLFDDEYKLKKKIRVQIVE